MNYLALNVLTRQDGILASQDAIQANQDDILVNQDSIPANQDGILLTQDAILASLVVILASQDGIMASHDNAQCGKIQKNYLKQPAGQQKKETSSKTQNQNLIPQFADLLVSPGHEK